MKSLIAFAAVAFLATAASANCRIHNDTKYDFRVESGHTSNQSVGAHTETSIDDGIIKGKDEKTGKTVSGSCKNGDHLEIKEEDGIPILTVK